MENMAIFASGEGTNAENIIHHFKDHALARVALVVSDKKDAPVLKKARVAGIESHYVGYDQMSADELLTCLRKTISH